MARELSAAVMAEFIKFQQRYTKVAGKISKYVANSSNGPFIVLQPAFVRMPKEIGYTRYHSVAVGLATDLRMKLQFPAHERELVSIELVDFEPTSKGSPRKVFTVQLLDVNELKEMVVTDDLRKVDDVYRKPASQIADEPERNKQQQDDDELPF